MDFADALLQPQMLGIGLGIATYMFIEMNYYSIQKKNKSTCSGKCLVHPIQVTGSTYCGIVFLTMYISKLFI